MSNQVPGGKYTEADVAEGSTTGCTNKDEPTKNALSIPNVASSVGYSTHSGRIGGAPKRQKKLFNFIYLFIIIMQCIFNEG